MIVVACELTQPSNNQAARPQLAISVCGARVIVINGRAFGPVGGKVKRGGEDRYLNNCKQLISIKERQRRRRATTPSSAPEQLEHCK